MRAIAIVAAPCSAFSREAEDALARGGAVDRRRCPCLRAIFATSAGLLGYFATSIDGYRATTTRVAQLVNTIDLRDSLAAP